MANDSLVHSHVSFLRLLLSCERLVASSHATSSAADARQERVRLLGNYLPVLQERLECLRNQAQQGIAEDGRAPAVSEQSLQQYAAKVVELKSVLVSAQQQHQHETNASLASRSTLDREQLFRRSQESHSHSHVDGEDASTPLEALHDDVGATSPPSGTIPQPAALPTKQVSFSDTTSGADGGDGPCPDGAMRTDSDNSTQPSTSGDDAGSEDHDGTGTSPQPRSVGESSRRGEEETKREPLSPVEKLLGGSQSGLRNRWSRTRDNRDEYERLMQEREAQGKIEESMMPMTRSFLETAKAINRKLEADQKKLDSAADHMEYNVDQVSTASTTLSNQTRSTWSDLCRSILMAVVVAVVFAFVVLVIKVTPNP